MSVWAEWRANDITLRLSGNAGSCSSSGVTRTTQRVPLGKNVRPVAGVFEAAPRRSEDARGANRERVSTLDASDDRVHMRRMR